MITNMLLGMIPSNPFNQLYKIQIWGREIHNISIRLRIQEIYRKATMISKPMMIIILRKKAKDNITIKLIITINLYWYSRKNPYP